MVAMRGKTAWSWSAKAFEASRNEELPRLLRRVLIRVGVGCYWAALVREGRAFEVWLDLRRQRSVVRRHQRMEAWRRRIEHVKGLLDWRGRSQCLPVQAWALPDSPKMRGLGLGRMWTVICPYCDEFHTHSPGEGHRTPHCCSERDRRHYILEFAGALPIEYRARFYRSSKSGLPRLLHRWPEPGEQRPEPTGLVAA